MFTFFRLASLVCWLIAFGHVASVAAQPAPQKSFRDCANCPEMLIIPGGTFTMGSSEERTINRDDTPQRPVTIAKPFAIGKFELKRGEFLLFLDETGYQSTATCIAAGIRDVGDSPQRSRSPRNPGFPQDNDHPVVCINFADAKAYLAWLTQKTGKRYRLLSESEWEYAGRGGSTDGNPWGDQANDACKHANVLDQSAIGGRALAENIDVSRAFRCTDGHTFTAPVGSYEPNQFGLHDMAGNVWELVEDCWHSNYKNAPPDSSPRVSEDCSERVARGTGWLSINWGGRRTNSLAERLTVAIKRSTTLIGFRVARDDLSPSQIRQGAFRPSAATATSSPAKAPADTKPQFDDELELIVGNVQSQLNANLLLCKSLAPDTLPLVEGRAQRFRQNFSALVALAQHPDFNPLWESGKQSTLRLTNRIAEQEKRNNSQDYANTMCRSDSELLFPERHESESELAQKWIGTLQKWLSDKQAAPRGKN